MKLRRHLTRFLSANPFSLFPRSLFPSDDPQLAQQMERLHHLQVWGRWLVVTILWSVTLPLSLWALRRDIRLWRDAFTWTAVRYALAFKPWVAIALALCIGLTVGVLVWQSRNILLGLPQSELRRLQRQVVQIRERGERHPLWRWVCK